MSSIEYLLNIYTQILDKFWKKSNKNYQLY